MVQRICRISNLATVKVRDGSIKPGLVPLSTATIWRWVKAGKFPKPFKLGSNTTVFDLDEIENWLKQRASEEHSK